MPHYLPNPELPEPEVNEGQRTSSSGPAAATSDADRGDAEPPTLREALRAIVRLLARQAARDHLTQGECL